MKGINTMTDDYEGYEPYSNRRELSEEELEAIATLAGVDAYDLTAGYPSGDCEPWEREFAVLLWNLCQFYTPVRERREPLPLADVDTLGLLICDVMHFLSRQQSPSLPAQIIATQMASAWVTVGTHSRSYPEGFAGHWNGLIDEAGEHFQTLLPKAKH